MAAAAGLFPEDQPATLPICGPHVINAALEAVLCLGSRELLLVGADFTARKRVNRGQRALGDSTCATIQCGVTGAHCVLELDCTTPAICQPRDRVNPQRSGVASWRGGCS